MNKAEFDSLPDGAKPANADKLMSSARSYRDIETRAYSGFSGTDCAEAPKHGLTADGLAALAEGKDPEATIALLSAKWRAYAEDNNRKVAAAPKTKRGPMAGHSAISHRWVSPDAFDSIAIFLRSMLPKEA